MIKVKKVIWEGHSWTFPDNAYVTINAPRWRAVYDGDKLQFEISDKKDAMDQYTWSSVSSPPTVFMKELADKLYKVENVRS